MSVVPLLPLPMRYMAEVYKMSSDVRCDQDHFVVNGDCSLGAEPMPSAPAIDGA
jgi:hypothetical protein